MTPSAAWSRLRRRLERHAHAFATAWSTPRTARGYVCWVTLATLACVAITFVFAALSLPVHQAVDEATRGDPKLAEALAPVLRRRFVLDGAFVVLALVVAPLLETLLIALGASLARERGWAVPRTVVVAGIAFGLLHAANGVLIVLPATAVFMVLTASYLRWRPLSLELALVAAAVPHLLTNALVVAAKVWVTLAR